MTLRDSRLGRFVRSHDTLHTLVHATWCRLIYPRVGSTSASGAGGGGGGPPPPPTQGPFQLGVFNVDINGVSIQWLNKGSQAVGVQAVANLTNALGQPSGVYQSQLQVIGGGGAATFAGPWQGGPVVHQIYQLQLFLLDSSGVQINNATWFKGSITL